MSDAQTPHPVAIADPREPTIERLQTPREHAAEIIECWEGIGLIVSGHRQLFAYEEALGNDILAAERRGTEMAARWHDAEAARIEALWPDGSQQDALEHKRFARSIRALADNPRTGGKGI